MRYDGIVKCIHSIACDARRIGRLLGYTWCYSVTIMVLLSVCLVLLVMLDASADFWDIQGVTLLPLWYC